MANKGWRFYVYDVFDADGDLLYVGKGSGSRVRVSSKKRGGEGCIVASFRRESDAYAFEVERIAELTPSLNKHPGGNGCRAKAKRASGFGKWGDFVASVGTKRYAAMLLLAVAKAGRNVSKLDEIRQVAHGYRA